MLTGTPQIVLVNQSSMDIPIAQLTEVARALQSQVDNDFAPAWNVQAVVSALAHSAPIPAANWPIKLLDQPQAGLGVHLDDKGSPFAEVQANDTWSLTASHELLEMLVDPLGQRFLLGPDIDPASDGHQVNYLVEVCDPCEVDSYQIGTVTVSDFVLPAYYNSATPPGVPVDHLGMLRMPFDVPSGCYLSWQDPQDDHWHQKRPDGTFTTAQAAIDQSVPPRDDRDAAFGPAEASERHNISAILRAYAAT